MISFSVEKNKEHNSLNVIKNGDTVIHLTERDLEALMEDIFNHRPDIFQDLQRFKKF